MAEWASGYVTEVTYTQGYYRELSPLSMRFALHCAGYKAPPAEGFSYGELGFGQGVSLNFHAAAHPDSQFFGADINPAHAANALEMARQSGATLEITDASFADLLARETLPALDYLALHGIWSWVSAENQAVLVALFERLLKPGGVLYLSYNCLPGWSQGMPLRHLMTLHAERAGTGKGVIDRTREAMAFTQSVADLNLGYFQQNPNLKDKVKSMSAQNPNYLVHEYMNRDWRIMHFAEVAEALVEARLDFAAAASPADQLDAFRIPAAGMALLNEQTDPIMRQTLRDYLVNQQFRRDLFVRGGRKLGAVAQQRALDQSLFVLMKPIAALRNDIAPGAKGIDPVMRLRILDAIHAVTGPVSMAELVAQLQRDEESKPTALYVRQLLMELLSAGEVSVAQVPDLNARTHAEKLNQAACASAGEVTENPALLSPVTGGAIQLGLIQMVLLHVLMTQQAASGGSLAVSELAARCWARLSLLGLRVVSGGKACQSEEENLAALNRIGQTFLNDELPWLGQLGIFRV